MAAPPTSHCGRKALKKKGLNQDFTMSKNRNQLIGIARGYRPEDPETLVDHVFVKVRENQELVFEHEAAFISYMKRGMYFHSLDLYKRDRRFKSGEDLSSFFDTSPVAFPPLHEVFSSLRGYDGSLPLRTVTQDRSQAGDDLKQAREFTITQLMEDYRANHRERAAWYSCSGFYWTPFGTRCLPAAIPSSIPSP